VRAVATLTEVRHIDLPRIGPVTYTVETPFDRNGYLLHPVVTEAHRNTGRPLTHAEMDALLIRLGHLDVRNSCAAPRS
jgi:hypothetical protein